MSTDSLVSSFPAQGWSCDTLQEGVEAAASMAGLSIRAEDAQEVG